MSQNNINNNMSQNNNNNNKWRHYTHLFLEKILTISQSFQTILFLLKFFNSDIYSFNNSFHNFQGRL